MGVAKAYTDGSYDNSTGKGGYGIVYIGSDGVQENYSGAVKDPSLLEMWNVGGELTAAIYTMKLAIARGEQELELYYDYQGVADWATGRWKAKKDQTQRYKKAYDAIKKQLKVHFIKVAAHTGVEYNELADKLAKKGAGKE